MSTKQQRPRWRTGAPNGPGWWLVEESTRDVVAWFVYWDRDEDSNVPRYLRFDDCMDSAPVAWHHEAWPVRRCYGPIPKPRKASRV
jgi:hypothetical protein